MNVNRVVVPVGKFCNDRSEFANIKKFDAQFTTLKL